MSFLYGKRLVFTSAIIKRLIIAALRPALLDPLFASVQSLKGVGPRLFALFKKLAGELVIDLLYHKPFRVIHRLRDPVIARAEPGSAVIINVEVQAVFPGQRYKPSRVRAGNDSGFVDLVYFHARGDFLEKTFPVGERRVVSGTLEDFNGKKQITHPDYVLPVERREEIPLIESVYPTIAGIGPKIIHKAMQSALARLPELPEWIDPAYLKQQKWTSWKGAMQQLHSPHSELDCEPMHPAHQRIAYDELLASQLALALVREQQRSLMGRSLKGNGKLRKAVLDKLPFKPTNAQSEAFKEIETDMASDKRMVRLLQGDVGSGKTLVALMAMLQAVETGAQAAIMAPTDLLAQQHETTIKKLLGDAGIETVFLTGRLTAAAKREAMEKIATGAAKIVIGTHALFQDDIEFEDLALIVIDEQHRFGVYQRLELSQKGKAPDLLVLTATPIPRTLYLTKYNHIDLSRLYEKPPGRKDILTRTMPLGRLEEVMESLKRKIATGEKTYWVCPLIEESEELDLAAATERFEVLKKILGPNKVRLMHGRMKTADRDASMQAFIEGEADVLVSTTVIEVGVDVKAATLMIIEHAERFGLAQLHQLRGRVGRSDKESACLLLYNDPIGEMAKARLKMMRETNDGFLIAEKDLELRSHGEVLGSKQSGDPGFRITDLSKHKELLETAVADAKLIIAKDAVLQTPRGKALRHLLYLLQYDRAIKTLRSG